MYVIFGKAKFPQYTLPLNQIIQYHVLLSRWVPNKKHKLFTLSEHMILSPVFHVAMFLIILVFCAVFFCEVSCVPKIISFCGLSTAWVRAGFVNYKKGTLDSQPQVINFTSCLPMVGGSLRVLRLLQPLKLSP